MVEFLLNNNPVGIKFTITEQKSEVWDKTKHIIFDNKCHMVLCTNPNQLADGAFLSADVVAAVVVTGSGGLVFANCC